MMRDSKNRVLRGAWVCALAVVWLALIPGIADAAPRFARATGTWTGTTWSATSCAAGTGAAVPAAGDDVTICSGVTVTLNTNTASLNSLTVDGTLTFGNSGTARTLTVAGNVTVNGTVNVSNNTATHSFVIGRDFTNNGSVNLRFDANSICNTTFNDATLSNIGGSSVTAFNGLTFTTGAAAINSEITVAATLAITGAITVTNNSTVTAAGAITGTVAGSTWTNAANSTLNITGALLATGTLNASASGNTIDFRSAANQTIKQASSNQYFNLTFSNGGTDSFPTAGSTQNILGDLTINVGAILSANTNDNIINVTGNMVVDGTYQASATAGRTLNVDGNLAIGGTFTGNAAPVTLAGNFTRTGTFTSGAGLFTFNGTVLQTLTGASTFTNVTVNNAAGLSLANDMTMTTAGAGTLTLTSGNIDAGANTLIVPRPCNAPSISRTSGHVIGNLRKAVPANASTCTFEVGSGANYTPVVLGLTAGTGAGDIMASTTGTAHPTPTGSGLSGTNYLNRYWTMTNTSATPAAGTTATFNYISGSPVDVNAGTESGFVVKRLTGGTWFSTTAAGCTPVSGAVCKGISDYAAGDFWIGEIPPADPDSFNAVEPGAAIDGRIFTKLRSVNFQLDIVAILSNALYSTFGNDVRVDLVTGGAAGSNCGGGSLTPVAGPVDVTLSSGRVTTPNFNVATAYADVRVRVRYPTTSPTVTTCSSDNFTIRPDVLSVSSTDATNTGTSGTPAIKTGANFNLTANGGAGYTGTPAENTSGNITGTPNAGTVSGSFSAAVGGAASGTFTYSEVGNFGLSADAVRDTAFVIAADQGNGDCIASSTSNTISGGKYGCWIGSTAVTQSTGSSGFGRFIPDNFNVTYNVPVFTPACGPFSYVGQTFSYSTPPEMTITARNSVNATTQNYAGSYMKFTNASLAPAAYDTQAERYSRLDALGGGNTPALDLSSLPATAADPTISTFTNGVGTFTFSNGSGFSFTRSTTTPSAAFDADIALTLNVIDADGVTFAGNPASFGAATAGNGMLFSDANAGTTTDKQMRYGRLRIGGASGSQLLPLRLPVEAQYWNGSVFVTNTLDSCTTLAAGNVGLGNHRAPLDSGETTATIVNSPLQSGRSAIRLSAPGSGNHGSVDVTLNLGSGSNADACAAFAPAATAGNLEHLRGGWCTPPGTYSKDPAAKARFGIMRSSDQAIYRREQ